MTTKRGRERPVIIRNVSKGRPKKKNNVVEMQKAQEWNGQEEDEFQTTI